MGRAIHSGVLLYLGLLLGACSRPVGSTVAPGVEEVEHSFDRPVRHEQRPPLVARRLALMVLPSHEPTRYCGQLLTRSTRVHCRAVL